MALLLMMVLIRLFLIRQLCLYRFYGFDLSLTSVRDIVGSIDDKSIDICKDMHDVLLLG